MSAALKTACLVEKYLSSAETAQLEENERRQQVVRQELALLRMERRKLYDRARGRARLESAA